MLYNKLDSGCLPVSPPHPGQADAGGGALAEDLAAEAEELGGAAAGLGEVAAGPLEEAAGLDEAPEVLLVERDPGERLDHPLELEESELRRQELEDDGPVLELAA